MKQSIGKLLAVVALLAAALCISAAARKIAADSAQDEHITIRVNAKAPASFDAQLSAGKVVAMTAVYPNGSKVALTEQNKPAGSWSCPSGQRLSCWEDHDAQMSMCACVASGGKGSSAVVSLGKLGRVE